MKVMLSLKPGETGTKRLYKKYGEKLVRVRFRYDESQLVRYKTVELIIEEKNWIHPEKVVALQLNQSHWELRDEVIRSGGWWDWAEQVWKIPYKHAKRLGLKKCLLDITHSVKL